jgi:hypothetical protein
MCNVRRSSVVCVDATEFEMCWRSKKVPRAQSGDGTRGAAIGHKKHELVPPLDQVMPEPKAKRR